MLYLQLEAARSIARNPRNAKSLSGSKRLLQQQTISFSPLRECPQMDVSNTPSGSMKEPSL